MTKKHTPGPWRMTANRKLVKVLAAGMPVASVTSERAEEDARLIALAPELLAFVESAITEPGACAFQSREYAEKRLNAITADARALLASVKP